MNFNSLYLGSVLHAIKRSKSKAPESFLVTLFFFCSLSLLSVFSDFSDLLYFFPLGTVSWSQIRTLAMHRSAVSKMVPKETHVLVGWLFRCDRDSLHCCHFCESSRRDIGLNATATLGKAGRAGQALVRPVNGQLGDEFDEQHIFHHAVRVTPLLSKLPM